MTETKKNSNSNRSEAFAIKLADKTIRIEPIFGEIRDYCKDYITNEEPDFVVRTEEEDIIYEREKSIKEAEREENVEYCYSDAYLETLAVYRQIAEHLLMYGILLFHGSVIAVDGSGYLFTAKSGTGKSTHTRLWREYFGERATMINDDKPLLKVTEDGVYAYGTPWNGKHRLSTNTSAPLEAICILTRANENYIEEISPKEAYQMLLQQTYRSRDNSGMIQTLQLIDEIMKKVKFYRLGCNREIEAAKVAFEGMIKKKEN